MTRKIIFGANGVGDDAMLESEVYVAIITDNWMQDSGCLGQAELAHEKGKLMFALIKKGTMNLNHIDRFNWQRKIYFENTEELQAGLDIILELTK